MTDYDLPEPPLGDGEYELEIQRLTALARQLIEENERLKAELKDTRENSWGVDEAVMVEDLQARLSAAEEALAQWRDDGLDLERHLEHDRRAEEVVEAAKVWSRGVDVVASSSRADRLMQAIRRYGGGKK